MVDMEACVENKDGYIVKVWQVMGLSNNPYCSEYGHYVPVVKFDCQSDAIDFRNLLQREGINENRLKLFIRNYDGKPRRIVLGRKDFRGEPILKRI